MAGRVAPYIDNTGLVFAYDQSNTVRSYLGEPTTNIMPYSQEFTSWGSNAVTLTPNATYAPDGTLTATLLKADGTASYHYIYQYLSTDSSATYTFSCYVKPAGGFNGNTNTFFMQTNDGSWKNTTFNLSSLTPSIDGWYRVSWTVSIATGGSLFWSVYPSPAPSAETAGGGYYIWGAQLEKKGHVTQYLPTGASTATRSATQGLKDLTGRSTIDLSNVSFDSNAQMVFDGSNDSLVVGNNSTLKNNNTSIEFIIKYLNTPNGDIIQFGVGSGTYAQYYYRAYSGNSYWNFYPAGGDGVGDITIPNAALPLNKFHHIVMTGNAQGYVQFYINGIAQSGANRSSYSQAANWTPADLTVGGFSWDGYSNSEIPYVKIYNRVLSASEIQQNFNAVRGRYGI